MSFLSLSTDPVTQAYPDQPLAVSGDATVGDVVQLMRAQKGSCVLVCDDDGGSPASSPSATPCAGWPTAASTSHEHSRADDRRPRDGSKPRRSVGHAIETMAEGGYRHLPIVDEAGVPHGVVAVRGIVHYLVEHFPETIYTLPPEPGKKPSDRDGA